MRLSRLLIIKLVDKLKIQTNNGYTEVVIDGDCLFGKFYAVAGILETSFHVTFTEKLNNFDTAYWDFVYVGYKLTLHYIVYVGVSIFPTDLKNASVADNEAVLKLGSLLFEEVANIDWFDYDGDDKLTTGTEGGTVVIDMEHSAGARITLEKDCGNIPFAITLGIYGLMMHTQFEGNETDAMAYVASAKFLINKIVEMYDVKSEDRDDYWDKKQDSLINELAQFKPDIAVTNIVERKLSFSQSTRLKLKKIWGGNKP